MTIADNYAPINTPADGVTTAFTGSWSMLEADFAQVYLQNQSTGVQTLITQGAGANQYEISITSSGFVVTFNTAPDSGNNVIVSRTTTRDQTNPYSTSRGFQGSVEEASFDKLTAMAQDTKEILGRIISAPVGDTATLILPTAVVRANKALIFDASGNVIVSTDNYNDQLALVTAEANAAAVSQSSAAASAATAVAAAASVLPNASSLSGTSVTSNTIGTGSKSFTTQAGKNFAAGETLVVYSNANPNNVMYGTITSYNSGTGALVVNVTATGGSGTLTDWVLGLVGAIGPQGATGADGSVTAAAATGTVDAITATYAPPVTLTDKTIVALVLGGANATTTPTFAPNSLTAHTITKNGGQALAPGDLPGALAVSLLEYNLANTRWELLNPAISSGIKSVKSQTFTGSGTYTPSAGMVYCIVRAIAGGGSGGNTVNGSGNGSAGGGGGGYAESVLDAATVGASQAVTIGAGGAGVGAGANDGNVGGNTTFGGLITCNGGAGGVHDTGTRQPGGSGGTASGGNVVNVKGQPGGPSISVSNGIGGWGANSQLGSGGNPTSTSSAGGNGSGYGAGGSTAPNGGGTSGAGAPGIVIVTEFCNQ